MESSLNDDAQTRERERATKAARDEAVRLLGLAVEKSKRREQVPFSKQFLRSNTGRPPLARMIHGGRGGGLRLRLYLTITMMATGAPFDLKRPPAPHRWTQMLAMEGPTGPRKVSSNLAWLRDNRFLDLEPRPGATPLITMLSSAGTGEPYEPPSKQGTHYITLPLGLWTQGWILELSPTALALFMVIRDVQRAGQDARYLSRSDRLAYGLSADTWTRATKELVRHDLLTVTRVPQGSEFDYQRMRNLFQANVGRLSQPPSA